jgi:hypothetical protein
MKKTTRIFLVGTALAALIEAGSVTNTYRLERRVTQLVGRCEVGNKHKTNGATSGSQPTPKSHDEPADTAKGHFVPDAPADTTKPKFDLSTARPVNGSEGPWTKYQSEAAKWAAAPLVCDPETLGDLDGSVGIQAEIKSAVTAVRESKNWGIPSVALFVLGIGAIPWFWYFLLRRLSEIRAALAGNAPNP